MRGYREHHEIKWYDLVEGSSGSWVSTVLGVPGSKARQVENVRGNHKINPTMWAIDGSDRDQVLANTMYSWMYFTSNLYNHVIVNI